MSISTVPEPGGVAAHRSAGFTLIEVLVAAFIMAVGLLGIVALQARSVQYNQQAYMYSQATILANDIAEAMRAQPALANDYQVNFGDAITGTSATTCSSGNCTGAQFVKWDQYLWKQALASALPQGDGSIARNGNQYIISVQFDDSRGAEQLRTVSVTIEL